MHVGDYQLEDTIHIPFTTRAFATGIPTVLAGTPLIDVYEDGSTTQVVTGESLTVDFDAVVGLNLITITATAATGFEAGKSYFAIIEAGTVGGVSVIGEVVGHFTIERAGAGALTELENATDGLTVLKSELDGIQADTEDLQTQIGTAGAGLTDLGGMSTGMKAEVNVEAKDVMDTDTITLPGQEAPPLAPTAFEAIAWLYKAFRNRKDQTATLWQLYADDESTVDAKATASDDATTAIKQEIVSGP